MLKQVSFTEVSWQLRTSKFIGKFGTAAASGANSNDAQILAPTATGDYGTVTSIVVMDALTGGNALIVQALDLLKLLKQVIHLL